MKIEPAYDYRNRVYSAELGRFLQTDPIRFNAGDGNLYRYALNSVSIFADPLGLKSCPIEIVAGHSGIYDQNGKLIGGLMHDFNKRKPHLPPSSGSVGYVGCGADGLNGVCGKSGIPGMPSNPKYINPFFPDDVLSFDDFKDQLAKPIQAAIQHGQALCSDSQSCCKTVSIKVTCTDKDSQRLGGSLCDYKTNLSCGK